MDPDAIVLPANQPADRFYLGGERIARFRGDEAPGDASALRLPEDWVGSTTCLAGEDELGLSILPDGRRLVDAVAADPVSWLGAAHTARYGTDTGLLVKLLDAGQRLPVHAHPDGAFAERWLGRAHGKTEAWHMLTGGEVHLGLREPISAQELGRLVAEQDTDALVGALHRREVAPGDTVFVPAGTLHAIGAGVFIVELQEPEDLSVLLEWRGFALDGESDGHLGLGFERALEAVDRRELTDAEVDALICRAAGGGRTLPVEADAFFRLDRVRIDGEEVFEAGFAVVVVLDGEVVTAGGAVLSAGTTAVVPHAAGPLVLAGHGTVVIARPPLP